MMAGMYAMLWLYARYHWPFLAAAAAIAVVAVLGLLTHFLIIGLILDAPPINQLLATGGLLFFLQSFATLLFSIEFRNIGVRLPTLEAAGMFISVARLLAFGVSLIGVGCLYPFLKRTYCGVAIRAIAQDRQIIGLMGIDQRRVYGIASAIGGALAGLAGCLLALEYDVHPFIGLSFGPILFMICVLGGLGNMLGGLAAAFIVSEIIAVGGVYVSIDLSYVLAFVVFIGLMFWRPRGVFTR